MAKGEDIRLFLLSLSCHMNYVPLSYFAHWLSSQRDNMFYLTDCHDFPNTLVLVGFCLHALVDWLMLQTDSQAGSFLWTGDWTDKDDWHWYASGMWRLRNSCYFQMSVHCTWNYLKYVWSTRVQISKQNLHSGSKTIWCTIIEPING